MPIPAGTRVGSYAIERLLGSGGMGEVYLAHDARLGRDVALKILPPDVAADPDRRTRFEREARMAAALKHPHICTIYEVGEPDGQLFIAMEYVEGTTLRDRARVDLFSTKETLDIAIQIADALDEARQRKVVHRDLKSANILLTPRGDVKILDFGLAKRVEDARPPDATTEGGVSDAGMVIGTAAYMSPEQALGQPVDHRSDLFSFGVVLYELLTGRLPFTGKTTMELFSAILHSAPQPIPRFNEQVPDALVRVVGKLLEKDREQRYQSAREVLNDLRKIRDEGASAPGPHLTRSRSSQWAVKAAAALAIVVIAGTVWWATHRSAATQEIGSIVVLPATIEAPGADLGFLVNGIPRALTQGLTGIPGLVPKSPPTRAEMDEFKNDIERIVTTFGADAYVQSAVLAQNGRVKVSVVLTEAHTRKFLWSSEYEDVDAPERYRPLIDRALAGLRFHLRPSAPGAAPAPITTNAEAWLAYQRGLDFLDKYNNHKDAKDFDAALSLFTQAMELDRSFADPAAAMSDLYWYRMELATPNEDVRPEVKHWAEKAVERQPTNSYALSVSAAAALLGDPPDRNAWLDQSLKAVFFGPYDPNAHTELAAGPLPEEMALAAWRRVHELRPPYLYAPLNIARALIHLGRPRDAGPSLDEALRQDPAFPQGLYVEALLLAGFDDRASHTAAQALLPRLKALVPDELADLQWQVARYAIAVANDDDSGAKAAIDAMRADAAEPKLSPLIFMDAATDAVPFLIRHGDTEDAIRWLTSLSARGRAQPYDVLLAPQFEVLRRDPRFQPVLKRSSDSTRALLAVVRDAKDRGQFPAYLEPSLATTLTRMGLSAGR